MKMVRVEIWSDVACPWCWVGKRRFEKAVARFDGVVAVRWRAFELERGAPQDASGVDYVGRLARKYGFARAGAQAMIDRMVQTGVAEGLDFRFDRVLGVNTFDAHRLLELASGRGLGDAMSERLFRAYFEEGRSVADHDTLVEIAAEEGLDREVVRAMLSTDGGAREVREDESMAAERGITGVPFFVIEQRYAVSGAQPTEVFLEALERAAADLEAPLEEVAGDAGEVCGPDGCAVPAKPESR